MTYTRKQAVTCISVLYLVIALGIAGYASSRANDTSVPISDTLTGLATALPIVAGILLEGGYDLTRWQERRQHQGRGETQRPPLVIIANTLIFIYSTVVVTLLGTHVAPPSELDCGLRRRWETLFKHKDSKAIKAIQDAFECCGLANSRDMAWPFPDKNHDARACEGAFGRTNSCLKPWKVEEQRVAGLLMGVVGMVFVWQFLIIAIPTQRESWLHSVVPDRISRVIADEEHGSGGSQRAIGYLPDFARYTDRVEEERDEDEQDTPNRAIEGGANQVNGALPGSAQRDQPPTAENEWART
ncbi:hypothetical protein P153DRAFT_365811 [Dothidotthia symphoricarpi CBS 119687]|uniref:Tetraspanin Tsp3 n=1 Tax=Dothidotthia symphoricarpi CBS 119687 TaxID=1392245 RepID=A0A6A6AHD3_9PLEO|nr:uncharacterized protein P153DRAFT_365811 [Dothidotthia symphoricarpi CBS 119687]KAF2131220.1 hypothetical protein P153DRAFT_365811 [Dothidotthia symphoricarpi CBS 119687]